MDNLALYLHWPFCKSKCPYCDFNSHVRSSIDETAWEEAFITELERAYTLTGPRELKSIFFGGGTPSLMNPRLVEKIIGHALGLWNPEEDIEITLEANPTSVETDRFKALRQAGVNRVSLGVQALNEKDLKFLGREHTTFQAQQALHVAKTTFPRVSFDLIYARPEQTLAAWVEELTEALTFDVDHLSLYQLTIEEGTAFAHQFARQKFSLPEENLAADMYEATIKILNEKDLHIYEISNFAKRGQESLHNLAYWTYQDYIGIGPGAHGRITLEKGKKVATRQFKAPETWLKRVKEATGTQEVLPLSLKEQAFEQLMMGLRLFRPFDLVSLPCPWTEIIEEEKLHILIQKNFIKREGDLLTLTLNARLCLNEVLRYLKRE